MELKKYQVETLETIRAYLKELSEQRAQRDRVVAKFPDVTIDFPKLTWDKLRSQATWMEEYHPKKNGLGEDLPNFCLKVPTGGGKTLLATKAVDLIQSYYTKRRNGFVLWIVPSDQIFKQTFGALTDRMHPYRQALDNASGGRTMILTKKDRFTPQDVREQLVIMILMLPSANRQNKETLKMFQDAGGFENFFPAEGNPQAQEGLLQEFPNLDHFGDDKSPWGRQVKTSLGNVLRILRPIIVLDEGHKSRSANAQATIRNFNPCIIVELTATPRGEPNVLVNVRGLDLNNEGMIKLDLHVDVRAGSDWKGAMLASIARQRALEGIALEYRQETGEYIRPICLIQVERTGREQRGVGYIHSEDVRDFLIQECGISPHWVAAKTSEKDEIENINLLSEDCNIRYIITKQALQEGWDCSFAYILCILSNPRSQTGVTQLVGRVLRQPRGRKTHIRELDESYVHCYQRDAAQLIESIRADLTKEGLGDLVQGHVISEKTPEPTLLSQYRPGFKKFEGQLFLPRFVIQDGEGWRELSYQMDLLSRLDWDEVSLDPVDGICLSEQNLRHRVFAMGFEDDKLVAKKREHLEATHLEVNLTFMTRQLIDIVPNPWVAFQFAEKTIHRLKQRYPFEQIADNFVNVVDELRKILGDERDRLSEQLFRGLIQEGVVRFLLEKGTAYEIPRHVPVKSRSRRLYRDDGEMIQSSLFDRVVEDGYNEIEKAVAICLDTQEKLLWWYRNIARVNYGIQGWKKHHIYPDFITAKKKEEDITDFSTIYVLETKGMHLVGNADTNYKQDVFKLMNELGRKTSWNKLQDEFPDRYIEFNVVYEREWRNEVSKLFA